MEDEARANKVDNRGYHRGDRIRFATCERVGKRAN